MHSSSKSILSIAFSLLISASPVLAQDLLWQTLVDSADKSVAQHNYQAAESQLSSALDSLQSADNKNRKDNPAHVRLTLRKLAQVYAMQAEYVKAGTMISKLLALDETNLKADKNLQTQIEFSKDLRTAALIEQKQDKSSAAQHHLEQSLQILRQNAKSDADAAQLRSEIIRTEMQLAMLYQDIGKYNDAEASLKEALAGDNDAQSNVLLLEQLARLYTVQNRTAEAQPILDKVLKLKEKNDTAAGTVVSLTDLGNAALSLGKEDDARKYFERALALAEREYGPTSDQSTAALLNLADLDRQQDKNAEAITLYEKALAQTESSFGKDSTLVGHVLVKLADVYRDTDKYDRAEELYKRAIKIEQAASGIDSRELANHMSNLALLYMSIGQYDQAEGLYKQALAAVEKKVGPSHPDTATCMNNLALLYRNEGKLPEAEDLIRKALVIRQTTLDGKHPAVARNLANLADIKMGMQQWLPAQQLLQQALDIERETLDPAHPDIQANLRTLAAVLEAQQKWSDAEATYKKLVSLDQSNEEDEATLASDLDGLSRVLVAQNKSSEAEPLAKRAAYIKDKLPGALAVTETVKNAAGEPGDGGKLTPLCPIKDKWALVVGISNFQDPSINLKYAAKDATDFSNYLIKDAHFQPDHVKLLTDKQATRQNIVDNLGDKWLRRLANSDDVVVIYISTHGSTAMQEAGRSNFIVPYDGNLDNIVFNGIPMQWLTAGIKDLVHCNRIVLVLDVCHGGAVGDGGKGLMRSEMQLVPSKLMTGDGQVVLASSQADQISWESKQYGNSVFTRRLLEGLRMKGDKTKLKEAFAYMKEKVEEEVLRDRAHVQTPVLITKWWQGDDISIATPPTKPRPGLAAGSAAGSQQAKEAVSVSTGKRMIKR